jgi:uncharacterized protein (TIGR00106 family)
MNFAIFPMDKGAHVGSFVSDVVQNIKNSGLIFEFTPMGTIIEGNSVDELLEIVKESYKILEPVSDRVYCSIQMDYHKHKENLIRKKRDSIESRIGAI